MIKAYHLDRGDIHRDEFLVPDSAHGTNPASAAMCGYKVIEIKTTAEGDIDLEDLDRHLSPRVAGMMLTNPSTLGVFERNIHGLAARVHGCGGLLYYDGANLNAILGKVRPGDMGFDVMHMNLHKTFATPHGGGGPGAGPVAANDKLKPYLPIPIVKKEGSHYRLETREDRSKTIGRLSAFHGNTGILMRAYIYAKLLGREGLERVALYATLNANYLLKRCQEIGFKAAYPNRRATHEFILTLQEEKKKYDINALEVSKRLLDHSMHAPTMYFPLLVPECLLVEPTETESKRELDLFIDTLANIRQEMEEHPERIKSAPHRCKVKRVDDVLAARLLDCSWKKKKEV
jgi:glycine dehydrogenase subunit 2